MTTAPPPTSRASLLAGLRTGGVRSSSASVPHTAGPAGSFNVPRFASQRYSELSEEEEEADQLLEIPSQNAFANYGGRQHPSTAAVDGPNNRFSQQQHRGLNPNSVPFSPGFNPNFGNQQTQVQAQALQLQMMQIELMKMQAAQQAQQYQAELMAQAQRQQQSQNRRSSMGMTTPATAGPGSNGFDLRSAALSAQMRRANQEGGIPMSAALGGKFGARSVSGNVMGPGMQRYAEIDDSASVPPTPHSTTVISGGTSLGSLTSNNVNSSTVPSKSDSVSSWRRGGRNNSVLSGMNRAVTSPSVRVTPPLVDRRSPPTERASPPLEAPAVASPTPVSAPKFRPQPLQFSAAVSQPLPVVAVVDSSDGIDNDDESSSTSAASGSSPTTPRSSSSNEMPLSPREEATKKLYEGLGIGRPRSAVSSTGMTIPAVTVNNEDGFEYSLALPQSAMVTHRMVSQPTRQPRGPPSGADELGPQNFATRIRRKAIGGLGMLMGARERREFVEAY